MTKNTHTASKMAAVAAAVVLTASMAAAGEGVEVQLRTNDAPQAGATGVLVGGAQIQGQGTRAAASDIDQRRDEGGGSGGSGNESDPAADPAITFHGTTQRDGGSFFCRLLEPFSEVVDVALLCD